MKNLRERMGSDSTRRVGLSLLTVLLAAVLAVNPDLGTQISAALIAAGSIGFVYTYHKSNWKKTKPGRSIMFLMIVAGLFGGYMLFITITHHYPVNLYLRGALYVLTAIVVLNLLWVLVIFRKGRF